MPVALSPQIAHQVATAATALLMPPPTVTLPLLLPVGELEPTLLTLDAGAGIKEPDAVTDNCSELASVTGEHNTNIDQVIIKIQHLYTAVHT